MLVAILLRDGGLVHNIDQDNPCGHPLRQLDGAVNYLLRVRVLIDRDEYLCHDDSNVPRRIYRGWEYSRRFPRRPESPLVARRPLRPAKAYLNSTGGPASNFGSLQAGEQA